MHEPSGDCATVHCYMHNVDEQGRTYVRCGECGHRYRSRHALRAAYRRTSWRIYDDHPWWTRAWLSLRTPHVGRIIACPVCSHDL